MRQQSLENRINELFAQLVTEIRGSTALGLTDINKFSEDCLAPVFRLALDLPGLRNLNQTEKKNFPAIDLADDSSETAIQVTATPDRSKVMDTLAKFTAHGLHTRYRRLLVYVITEKQERYPDAGVSEALEGHIDFNINRDVIDYRDVLRTLHGKSIASLDTIVRALERQLSQAADWALDGEDETQPKEWGHLNLIPITFPRTTRRSEVLTSNYRRKGIFCIREDPSRNMEPVRWEIPNYDPVLAECRSDNEVPRS